MWFTTSKINLSLLFCMILDASIDLCASAGSISQDRKDTRPVIGVLTQLVRDYKRFGDVKRLHIASSYVKWIEAAGAQVVPILLNQNDSYYGKIFELTNGLLFPGGDNLLDPKKDTPMLVAAKKLYKLAVDANNRGDFYPIWGTCLGFELLTVLSSGRNILVDCEANDIVLPVKFVESGRLFAPSTDSKLLPDYSKTIMDIMSSKNLTYNVHHFCVTDQGLAKAGLTDFYRPLGYSEDSNGLPFITIIEARNYPFYATMFHSEKPPFELVLRQSQRQIPHSQEALAISRYMSDFFVASSMKNNHQGSRDELEDLLVYAYNATYTAPVGDIYEQRYFFPYQDNGLTTEEFLDYIPDDTDAIPESVSQISYSILTISLLCMLSA